MFGLLDGSLSALALQCPRCHQALNLGGLAVLLAVGLELTTVSVHVLADVVILGQVEQLADLKQKKQDSDYLVSR